MRNFFKLDDLYNRAYIENAAVNQQVPTTGIPHLLKKARPVHEVVKVDIFLPGCPPPPDVIYFLLTELLEGRTPDLTGKTRFGI
jgi:NAD-reducing hydrogenase small subunit